MIKDKIKEESLLVSVVIPTYGRSDLLERAIKSILAQTYTHLEIIVVDDNDPSSSHRQQTEKFMQSYENNNRIVYHKHEKNAGGCAARNSGIGLSKGEYVGFLDDDDEWLPAFIEKHLEKFVDKSIGAVYCNYDISYDSARGSYQSPVKSTKKKGMIFNDLIAGWSPASTSLFLIRKECFSRVGLFDESLESFQDYDMWLQISQEFKFDFCDEYLVIKHQHTGEQISVNPGKRQNGLTSLKMKWSKLLNQKNYIIFLEGMKKHQTAIYYNEFLVFRKNKEFYASILTIIKFIKMGNIDFIQVLKMFLILLFGVKLINGYYSIKKNSKFFRFNTLLRRNH